jgi:methylmalonyl-CoA/ethylmalonyl-CoA epimerase
MLKDRVVSHYGYAVDDMAQAVRHWSTVLGAGPFVLIENMQFDSITHLGEPCTFQHSAAFGQWGPIAIELMLITDCTPPSLARQMIPGAMPVLNHVSYLSENPDKESAYLDGLGAPKFLEARFGAVEVKVHDASHLIGCNVEIHLKSDFIEGFFANVKRLSDGWNGQNPLRPFDPTA